ncbi:MAG: epimerase, partial [Chloroflexi bacterium]
MLETFPEVIHSEEQLDELLSRPSRALIEMAPRLDGDLIIMGIAGKMGLALGAMAVRAIQAANISKKVYGVARFTDPAVR